MLLVTDKEAMQFFFEAMSYILGSELVIIPNPHKPDFGYVQYEKGDFRLAHEWCITPCSHKTSGTTTIWYAGKVIWEMSFWGEYTDEAKQFLDEALRAAYTHKSFFGGRGPLEYKSGNLTYLNMPDSMNFPNFHGVEIIRNIPANIEIGWLRYQGGSLL